MSTCLLLCEDKEQEWLIRPLLEPRFRRVYVEPRRPDGGYEFVRNQVQRLARTPAIRKGERVCLVVVFDGDTKDQGPKGRLSEVRRLAELSDSNEAWTRQVAILVPCRHVETWVVWLTEEAEIVDETIHFKSRIRNRPDLPSLVRSAARAWTSTSAQRLKEEQELLPALAAARIELARILKVPKAAAEKVRR